MSDLKSWEDDPALYLFTSLTAGSSHIITATSRIETILKASRIPFSYVDTATNEGAKKLFQRRARGKKLPLLVKEGFVIADLEQVEDWNEFGELKDAIGEVATTATSVTTTPAKGPTLSTNIPLTHGTPSKPAAVTASAGMAAKGDVVTQENKPTPMSSTMAQLAQEAAAAVKEKKSVPAPLKSTTNTPSSSSAAVPASTETSTKEDPLSPTSIPLPATPSIASPLVPASPRHSVSSPKFVPERAEPPHITHRGSSLSLASNEEIRKIESDEMILEAEEEDEDEEESLPAIKTEGGKADEVPVSKDLEDKKTVEAPTVKATKKEDLSAEESVKPDEEETSVPKASTSAVEASKKEVDTPEPKASTETKKPTADVDTTNLADEVSKVKIED